MRQVTIELPDAITINGAKDAPESLRTVKTEKWDADFLLTAIRHGVSQRLGDVWSVSKKDVEKLTAAHTSVEAGEWTTRTPGDSLETAKKASGKLDAQKTAELIKILQAKLDAGEGLDALSAE